VAAARYQLSPGALRKRAERGQVPGAAKDGSRWLIDVATYDRALASGRLAADNKEGSRRANGRARGTGGMSSHA
jgi:hypothetical protein